MKEIGGYFELELKRGNEYHNKALKLNCGRNALLYILKSYKPKKIYIPFYICNSVLEPIKKEKIEFEFYQINEKLDPNIPSNFMRDDYLLYINYFGIKDTTSKKLADKIQNLILDNSQAFYCPPFKYPAFYSPRKFFGVSDGAYLYTEKFLKKKFDRSVSFDKSLFLLKRMDLESKAAFNDYQEVENSFSREPIRYMSKLTEKILTSIDYEKIKEIREDNFIYIHEYLKDFNELEININDLNAPMIFPFLIKNLNLKKFLIKNKIYIPTYWKEVMERVEESSFDNYLTKNLNAIPIDQRYDREDMKFIINKIMEVIK